MTDGAHAAFFDSNIVVYLFSADTQKSRRSEQLIDHGGVISVQVLNETALALRRKFNADWDLVRDMSRGMRANCSVEPLTEATHVLALELAAAHHFRIYDASIIASAQLAGCSILWSEDMHDGLVLNGLTIRNPYAS